MESLAPYTEDQIRPAVDALKARIAELEREIATLERDRTPPRDGKRLACATDS